MRNIFIVILILLAAALNGCGAKPQKPRVSVFSFEDENYPCIRIDFPDQIRYSDMSKVSKDKGVALVYRLNMPGYKIEVSKLYALEGSWNTESLPSLYDNPSKVFEISDTENPDKSAVITIEENRDGIYLKGSVGYFIQSNRGVRVDIIRSIKKAGTFKAFGVEEWRNSTIGSRTIENMKNILSTVYESLSTRECTFKEGINADWWN